MENIKQWLEPEKYLHFLSQQCKAEDLSHSPTLKPTITMTDEPANSQSQPRLSHQTLQDTPGSSARSNVGKPKRPPSTCATHEEPSKKQCSLGGQQLPEGAHRLTQRSTAHTIITITNVPDTLDVPQDQTNNSATWYLLKLTNHPLYGQDRKHKEMRMKSVMHALV